MAVLSVLLVLLACEVSQTWGLQVAPNSACSSVCLDDPSQDVSDPNVSNTNGSDIVCNDVDYQNTAVGSKFKQCISCLQNSTASDSGETDIEWFLYNIRYAFDTCIFGYANATHPISTPCSTDTVCAPLKPALEASMESPSSGTKYAYCSANDNIFLSSALQPCISCFKQTDNEAYFANFLVALQGGCVQQPKVGSLIGLDGTLFSSVPVNITSPITPGAKSHKTLSIGAIIGIAIGGVALLLIIAAVTFICIRKHRDRRRISHYVSKLDERHGNRNISVPTQGAYTAPLAPASPPWEDLALQKMQIPTFNPESKPKATFLGKEDYRAADQHYERQKTRQQQQALAQGLGFIDISHSRSYNPTRDVFSEPPAPAYTPSSRSPSERLPDLPTPPVPSPPIPSPPGSGRGSIIRTTTFVPYYNSNPVSPIESSPTSSPPVSGSTAKRSSATTISTTRSSKKSPIIGSGLPKEPSPRSRNFNNPGRQRYHYRDLSAGRGSTSSGPFETGSTSAPMSISGPMVSAGSRFTEEEEVNRGETLRARAYDQGFGGWKDPMNESAIKERDSEDSDDSGPEMWPGSY